MGEKRTSVSFTIKGVKQHLKSSILEIAKTFAGLEQLQQSHSDQFGVDKGINGVLDHSNWPANLNEKSELPLGGRILLPNLTVQKLLCQMIKFSIILVGHSKVVHWSLNLGDCWKWELTCHNWRNLALHLKSILQSLFFIVLSVMQCRLSLLGKSKYFKTLCINFAEHHKLFYCEDAMLVVKIILIENLQVFDMQVFMQAQHVP